MNFDIRWKGVTHQQIWNWVHASKGATSGLAAERTLESLNKVLINAVNTVAKTLEKTEAVWKGEAAAKAKTGMHALRLYTDGLQTTSYNSRNRTGAQGGLSDWARKSVPPVQNAGPNPAKPTGHSVLDVLKQLHDWHKREAEARNAERRAQEVMEQYTSNTRARVEGMRAPQQVPEIVLNTKIAPPPAPPAPKPGVPQPRGRDRVPRGGGLLGAGGSGDGYQRPETRPGEVGAGRPGEGVQSPQPGRIPVGQNELVWNPDVERGVGSSSSGAVGGGYSGGTYSGGTGFGGGGGFSGGGFVGRGGGAPAPHGPLGGGTGRGGTAAPGPVTAAGSPAPRGTGASGQQGFLQPASGAQRAEDSEHQRKYWVPGSDLFEDDRLVPPPVIGED